MHDLDLTGLACPMPVVKLKKFLAQHPEMKEPFRVRISDSGGLKDIPAFCRQQGLVCERNERASGIEFTIQRSSRDE